MALEEIKRLEGVVVGLRESPPCSREHPCAGDLPKRGAAAS